MTVAWSDPQSLPPRRPPQAAAAEPAAESGGEDYSLRFRSLLAGAMLRAAEANAAYHREERNYLRAMFAQYKADRRRKAIVRAAASGGVVECPNRLDDLRQLTVQSLDRLRAFIAAPEPDPAADEGLETGPETAARVVTYLELGERADGPRNLRLGFVRELSRPQTAWPW